MATRLERSCRTRAVAAQNRDTVTSDKSWTMGRGSVDDQMSDYHDLLNIGENGARAGDQSRKFAELAEAFTSKKREFKCDVQLIKDSFDLDIEK